MDNHTIEKVMKNQSKRNFGKGNTNHQQIMIEYNKKFNYPENTRIFMMNSQDNHIRRCLLQLGFQENSIQSSPYYDIKWNYTDTNEDYLNIKPGQLFNHFKNNTEITTKSRLATNLKQNQIYGQEIEGFFPRCFDLGNENERQEFIQDYEMTSLLILLKKTYKKLKQQNRQEFQDLKQKIQQQQDFLEKNKYNESFQYNQDLKFKRKSLKFENIQENSNKQQQNNKKQGGKKSLKYQFQKYITKNYEQFCCQEQKNGGNKSSKTFINKKTQNDQKFHIISLVELIRLLSEIKTYNDKKDLINCNDIYNENNYNQIFKNGFKIPKQMLVDFSKYDLPYENNMKRINQKFELYSSEFSKQEYWKYPNQNIRKKIFKLYFHFKQNYKQFKSDGNNNVWVVKPSLNSKGQGIILVNDMVEALQSGAKMAARVIQKYIEKPFLFQGNFQQLSNKKFDLRQWVLVTSFSPLKIYMYQHSYLRICSSKYDINDIKTLLKHLTNYSLNKVKSQTKEDKQDSSNSNSNNDNKNQQQYVDEDSVCDIKNFDLFLKNYYLNNKDKNLQKKFQQIPTYDTIVKPQITDIIIKTLKSTSDLIIPSNNCFELYGFDILLDKNLKAWLLEVNLSPACAERSEFLKKMVDDMTYNMFKILFKDEIEFPEEQQNINTWECIYDNSEEYNLAAGNNSTTNNSVNTNNFVTKNNFTTNNPNNSNNISENNSMANQQYSSNGFQQNGVQSQLNLQQVKLEIEGTSCNLKKEKLMDKKYFENEQKTILKLNNAACQRQNAAIRIQGLKNVKKAKRMLKRLKRLKKHIKLQSYIKMFLVRIKYKRNYLDKKWGTKIIQRLVRGFLARRYVQKLRNRKNEEIEFKKAQKIQQEKYQQLKMQQNQEKQFRGFAEENLNESKSEKKQDNYSTSSNNNSFQSKQKNGIRPQTTNFNYRTSIQQHSNYQKQQKEEIQNDILRNNSKLSKKEYSFLEQEISQYVSSGQQQQKNNKNSQTFYDVSFKKNQTISRVSTAAPLNSRRDKSNRKYNNNINPYTKGNNIYVQQNNCINQGIQNYKNTGQIVGSNLSKKKKKENIINTYLN